MKIFETKRLSVRTAELKDAPSYFKLWTDPQVMTNVGFPQGLKITEEQIKQNIKDKLGKSEYDQCLAVELRTTGEFVGECKLHRPDEEGIAGTDVKLLPEHWGNKYGVEVKIGLLYYLFCNTDCKAVEASPNKNNKASIKMQESVGGICVREETYKFPEEMKDHTCTVHSLIYLVTRESWERNTK